MQSLFTHGFGINFYPHPGVWIAVTPGTTAVKTIIGAAIPKITVVKHGVYNARRISRLNLTHPHVLHIKHRIGATAALIVCTAKG